MNAPKPSGERATTIAELSWIDQMADRFESAWKSQSSPPELKEFLAQVKEENKVPLLRELVKIDRQYRERTGAILPPGHYVFLFEELLPPGQTLPDGEGSQTNLGQALTIAYVQAIDDQGPCPLPDTIGKYRVVARLGAGTQGEVFRCFDPGIGREVAIKVGKKRLGKESAAWDSFLGEARAMARAEHPNLVRVYDHGIHEDQPYLVTEFVQGCSLEKWLHRPLPAGAAANLVAGLARGLAAVHRCNMTHQDLKPANILIDEHGQPRIIDFGLARHRTAWSPESGPSGGTPAYMAPEQARGDIDRVGPASDIFGVGAILFFVLTGKAPLADKDVGHVLARARRGDIDRSALVDARVPWRVAAICLRALACDPRDRYPRAEDLAVDLESYVRRPQKVLFAAALALTLVGLSLWLFWPTGPAAAVPTWQSLIEVLERKDKIYKAEDGHKLRALAPLKQGDRVVLRCDVPHGYSAGFFRVDASGRIDELTPIRSNPVQGHDRLRFPATGSWTIEGPPGTLFFLVCAGRDRQPRTSQVEQALQMEKSSAQDWPGLPPEVILLMNREDVEPYAEELPRGFAATAFTKVSDRLEVWRGRLRETFDYSWGVALPQN